MSDNSDNSDSDVITSSEEEEQQASVFICQRCPGQVFASVEEKDRHIEEDRHLDSEIPARKTAVPMARRGGVARKAPYERPMAKRTGTPAGPQFPTPSVVESSNSQTKNGRPFSGQPTATRGRAMKSASAKSSNISPQDSKSDK